MHVALAVRVEGLFRCRQRKSVRRRQRSRYRFRALHRRGRLASILLSWLPGTRCCSCAQCAPHDSSGSETAKGLVHHAIPKTPLRIGPLHGVVFGKRLRRGLRQLFKHAFG
ncbi:hypothetical protein D3C78_1547140 [compost metagenome]